MSESPIAKLRLNKVWQGERGFLVWQASPFAEFSHLLPKKVYLIADTAKPNIGFRFSKEKPQNLKPSGAMVALVRKHAAQSVAFDIFYDKEQKLYTLATIAKSEKVYFCINQSSPPMINLVIGSRNLARFGTKGCYTKACDAEFMPAVVGQEKAVSILDELCAQVQTVEHEDSANKNQTDAPVVVDAEIRELRKRLNRRLKTLRKSSEKEAKKLPGVEEIKVLETQAKYLQSYAYLAKYGDVQLKLEPSVTGLDKNIVINLDPDISIGQNIESLFKDFQRKTKGRQFGLRQLEKTQKQIEDLEKKLLSIDKENENVNLEEIKGTTGLKAKQATPTVKTDSSKKSFKTYKDENGVLYLLGKGPKENDFLTKSAKSNDWWVHVTSGTGSHVIIKTSSIKGKTPGNKELHTAGILAIHNSKQRGDLSGEVYVTKKQHLRKPKGIAPGKWLVDRSEVVFYKYDEAQLKQVLGFAQN